MVSVWAQRPAGHRFACGVPVYTPCTRAATSDSTCVYTPCRISVYTFVSRTCLYMECHTEDMYVDPVQHAREQAASVPVRRTAPTERPAVYVEWCASLCDSTLVPECARCMDVGLWGGGTWSAVYTLCSLHVAAVYTRHALGLGAHMQHVCRRWDTCLCIPQTRVHTAHPSAFLWETRAPTSTAGPGLGGGPDYGGGAADTQASSSPEPGGGGPAWPCLEGAWGSCPATCVGESSAVGAPGTLMGSGSISSQGLAHPCVPCDHQWFYIMRTDNDY